MNYQTVRYPYHQPWATYDHSHHWRHLPYQQRLALMARWAQFIINRMD